MIREIGLILSCFLMAFACAGSGTDALLTKRVTSNDGLLSVVLDSSFQNTLNERFKRNIPGANLVQFSKTRGFSKLVFGQVIFLGERFKGLSFEAFIEQYQQEMQKTQQSFKIENRNSHFQFHVSIIRGIDQICVGKLYENNTKLVQVCGRTASKDYVWIQPILDSVRFYF